MGEEWVDMHSHVLPGIDDGSRSAEESLQMLRESARQQVGLMVATPHFYANQNTPEHFLYRRAEAYKKLVHYCNVTQSVNEEQAEPLPQIVCGAEVAYFTGMSSCEELPQLCIEGTNVLLLEMPFCHWSSTMLQEVLTAKEYFGLQIIIAHIERYIDEQPFGTLEEMLDEELIIQANAECFLHWNSRGRALSRVRNGQIQLLGSDCHNMTVRPPNLQKAIAVIGTKCGLKTARTLCENAWILLEQAEVKQLGEKR